MLDLVKLAALTPAEGRRVEQHGIVAPAAFDFPREEFVDVVDDPADRIVGQVVQRSVLSRPLHHALGCVHVAAVCAALRGGECGAARIGEKIEKVEWLASRMRCLRHAFADPVPHGAGFGEDAEVTEVGGRELHPHPVDLGDPGVRQPFASAPFEPLLSGEEGVGLLPDCRVARIPDGLRAGSVEGDLAKAFQFAPVAAVEEFVFVHLWE